MPERPLELPKLLAWASESAQKNIQRSVDLVTGEMFESVFGTVAGDLAVIMNDDDAVGFDFSSYRADVLLNLALNIKNGDNPNRSLQKLRRSAGAALALPELRSTMADRFEQQKDALVQIISTLIDEAKYSQTVSAIRSCLILIPDLRQHLVLPPDLSELALAQAVSIKESRMISGAELADIVLVFPELRNKIPTSAIIDAAANVVKYTESDDNLQRVMAIPQLATLRILQAESAEITERGQIKIQDKQLSSQVGVSLPSRNSI